MVFFLFLVLLLKLDIDLLDFFRFEKDEAIFLDLVGRRGNLALAGLTLRVPLSGRTRHMFDARGAGVGRRCSGCRIPLQLRRVVLALAGRALAGLFFCPFVPIGFSTVRVNLPVEKMGRRLFLFNGDDLVEGILGVDGGTMNFLPYPLN